LVGFLLAAHSFEPQESSKKVSEFKRTSHETVAGTEYQILDWLGVAGSGFDIAPWGSQTLDSRVVGNGAGASGGHGRPFENGQKVTGGSTLTADNGFATAVVFSPRKTADFTVGYSRSTHYDLNTFSFGVTLNMRELLRRSSL
jgi:hypothetical protein